MNHITDDGLLALVLETIESGPEQAEHAAHLNECADCRARLARVQREIAIIGGLKPRGRPLRLPSGRRRFARALPLLKTAALLAIGFVLGLGVTVSMHHETVRVVPAYLQRDPPPDSLQEFAAADATEPVPRVGGSSSH